MSAKRVLGVFAHPDDESVLAGGILASAAARGSEVTVVCATRGENGPVADGIPTGETVGEVREAELHAACGELGVRAVECLRLPDGSVEDAGEELVREVGRRLEELRPDVVVTFGPEGLYWHPDHVAVHEAVAVGVAGATKRPAVQQVVWPQGWMHELVATLRARGREPSLWGLDPGAWGADAGAETVAIDVRPHLDAKLRAIRRHESQLSPDHLFRIVPRDLAETYLGCEHVLAPPEGVAVEEAA